jgi:carbonic anhydrase
MRLQSMGPVAVSAVLVLALGGCASMRRHGSTPPPSGPSVVTEASADDMSTPEKKAAPAKSDEGKIVAAEPNVKMSGFPTSKSGVVKNTSAQPDIKLIDKNGKVITAPANAQAKGGKEMTKVEMPIVNDAPTVASGDSATGASSESVGAATGTSSFVKSSRKPGPISADKALGWLKNGNTRFVKGNFRRDGASAKDRRRIASETTPHAIILADSDSRIPPEIVFDQKLGEVYVVRVAGLALSENVIGSIEYAMEYLGTNLIVVLGEENSSAVKAAFGTLDGGGLGSPNLNAMIAAMRPHLQDFKGKSPSEGLIEESWANADGVAHEMSDRSQIIREGLTSKDVKIVLGLYHTTTGLVEWK